MTAAVDVIVPVHSAQRPVGRLAESILTTTSAPVRLIVVAHDTDPAGIATALGRFADDRRVQLLAFSDGVPSPAGPLHHGLGHVTAGFFTKVDSDDRLAPGALDSWLRTAAGLGADIVMPRMSVDGVRGGYPTPPRRRGRRVLDPVRDRLAYRTSTMGLIAARLAEAATPSDGLVVGEDIVPSVRLWFGGARIVRADRRAAYLVGSSARDRTTAAVRPLADELAFARVLTGDAVFTSLPTAARASIVAKMLRVHLSGSALRAASRGWPDGDLESLADAAAVLRAAAPDVGGILSRADADLLDALTSGQPDAGRVGELAAERGAYLRPRALLTRDLRRVPARDAPPRFLAASVLARAFG